MNRLRLIIPALLLAVSSVLPAQDKPKAEISLEVIQAIQKKYLLS